MNSVHYLEVLPHLQQTDVMITPNRRLASFLQQVYQQQQIDAGKTCFETPLIVPVNTWIDSLWQQYSQQHFADVPLILNSLQEQQLWESILGDAEYQGYFLQLSETARLVKSARGLLKMWQVSVEHPLFTTSDDYHAFTSWLTKFEAQCHAKDWVDAACLPELVRDAIANELLSPPANLYYAGFTELSPALQSLLDTCPNVTAVELSTPNQNLQRVTTQDDDNEIRLCANWAKVLHEEHPNQLIGCVIPMLDKKRHRIAQLFAEVFGETSAYNISAGQPLSHYPVMHAALQLLTLNRKQITAETLYFILSTPFISAAETERLKRSQFDSRLRGKNFSTIAIDQQIHADKEEKGLSLAKSCPLLAKRIREFKVLLEGYSKLATYAEWAQRFNQLLSKLGWPGERVINSEEYQVIEEWLKLLQSLNALDYLAAPVDYYQALTVLTAEAAVKTFQPQSPAANVQVLGILEASGLIYDQLWICGMDDSSWPAQPKPNPFIPKKLQRELKMPHASAERELDYCEAMTQQFCRSAGNVIFSYAKNHDDTIREVSPLIRHLREVNVSDLIPQLTTSSSEQLFKCKMIEEILDETAPPIQPTDKVSGGVDIIKNQALCPFKAFAECRLNARELESPLPGLRAKERGTIMHYILEKCWDTIQTSETLHEYSDVALDELLDGIIVQALLEHAPAQSHQTSYLALEKIRLKKLALDWLQLEKQRPPFRVINSEKSAVIPLNQLSLQVRIDRIDELPDGKKLIIDYKTSTSRAINHWLGERPDEPQLPLYAQLDSEHTAGIAFAQVAAREHKFKGISQYDLAIEGIKTPDELRQTEDLSWPQLVAQWQQVLTKLGDDFAAGIACVDPKEKQTCTYCKLQPLCRIHQDGTEDDDSE